MPWEYMNLILFFKQPTIVGHFIVLGFNTFVVFSFKYFKVWLLAIDYCMSWFISTVDVLTLCFFFTECSMWPLEKVSFLKFSLWFTYADTRHYLLWLSWWVINTHQSHSTFTSNSCLAEQNRLYLPFFPHIEHFKCQC